MVDGQMSETGVILDPASDARVWMGDGRRDLGVDAGGVDGKDSDRNVRNEGAGTGIAPNPEAGPRAAAAVAAVADAVAAVEPPAGVASRRLAEAEDIGGSSACADSCNQETKKQQAILRRQDHALRT